MKRKENIKTDKHEACGRSDVLIRSDPSAASAHTLQSQRYAPAKRAETKKGLNVRKTREGEQVSCHTRTGKPILS
jgi:hypothetical protein